MLLNAFEFPSAALDNDATQPSIVMQDKPTLLHGLYCLYLPLLVDLFKSSLYMRYSVTIGLLLESDYMHAMSLGPKQTLLRPYCFR